MTKHIKEYLLEIFCIRFSGVSNISNISKLMVKYFISSQVDPAGLWEEADGGIIV